MRRYGSKGQVTNAATKSNENDEPIDNLDKVAVKGRVRLLCAHEPFYGGPKGKDYRSDVLENPTWLQVAVHADEMIRVTNDHHHVFLEGLDKLPKKQQTEAGVTLYEFCMGS